MSPFTFVIEQNEPPCTRRRGVLSRLVESLPEWRRRPPPAAPKPYVFKQGPIWKHANAAISIRDMLRTASEPDNVSSLPAETETTKAWRHAIDNIDLPSVRQLLASDTALDCQIDRYGRTPLHYSVQRYLNKVQRCNDQSLAVNEDLQAKEIIKDILAAVVRNGSSILERLNGSGRTLLYITIAAGNLELVKALIAAGANLEGISDLDETVLHAAAKHNQDTILEYFLDNHNVKNSVDQEGYTPVHCAAKNSMVQSVILLLKKFGNEYLDVKTKDKGWTVCHTIACNREFSNSHQSKYFLQAFDFNEVDLGSKVRWFDWNNELLIHVFPAVNEVDDDGETPVFKASSRNLVALTAFLLRHGATLSVNNDEMRVVDQISANFANPLSFFENLFDGCILGARGNYYVCVNYEIMTDGQPGSKSQIQIIEQIVARGHSTLLQHPVIESLICLKWNCLLSMFYLILTTYTVFLVSFNIFVITTFNRIDNNNNTYNVHKAARNGTAPAASEVGEGSCGWEHWTLITFMYISIGVLLFQEFVWIFLRKFQYFMHPEFWVRLGGMALAAVVPVSLACSPTSDTLTWQRYVACAALLLTWMQAMLLLSRFPGWGFYAFQKVALDLSKILVKATCFVIGFSSCFMILYKSKPPFDGPVSAFVKTLVMMSSEFDYENLFDENHEEEIRYTKPVIRLLFIFFVVFIAIVLMNFMVGVAVSDINELNDVGNIRRLEKQVELLGILEGLENTVLAKWWTGIKHMKFHRRMYVQANNPDVPDYILKKKRCSKRCCKPRLHSELFTEIFNIAKKKRSNLDTLDALYEAVVGAPYDPKSHDANGKVKPHNATLNKMSDVIESIENINKERRQQLEVLDVIKRSENKLELTGDTKKTMMNDLNIVKNSKYVIEEIKQSATDNFKNVSSRIESIEDAIKDIKQSIGDIKSDLCSFIQTTTSLLEKKYTKTTSD